jgi:hypothetical protein
LKKIHRSRRWEENLSLLYKPSISVYDFIRTLLNPARSLANTDPNPEDLAEGPRAGQNPTGSQYNSLHAQVTDQDQA